MRKGYARRIAVLSLGVALAMILSFVESLIPPLTAVPGVKLGLPNIVIVFIIYSLGFPSAILVSAVRILLMGLLFGNVESLMLSASGAFLSLLFMFITKKISFAAILAVSIVGAIMHNLGQVIAAALIMRTAEIMYYFIPLIVSGVIAGAVIGIAAAIVYSRVGKYVSPEGKDRKGK